MEQKYRHEYKYSITYGDYIVLRNRLKHIMLPDPHVSSNGKYCIHSIYFDNFNDKALNEKLDGICYREKYRIRYYGNNKDYIVLEKKIKNNNLCCKQQYQLTYEQTKMILNNDISFMKHSDGLLHALYLDMIQYHLKPRVVVSYTREPYVYQYGNVRVTFDSNIRSTMYHKVDITQPIHDINTTDDDYSLILEVKYDNYLPDVIFNVLHIDNLRLDSFSKYGICRKFG